MVRLNLLSHLFDRIAYLNYFGVMQIVQIYFYEIKNDWIVRTGQLFQWIHGLSMTRTR